MTETPAWPAPITRHLEHNAPGTTYHLDRLYDLLNTAELDRCALLRGLDNLTNHLDDRLHSTQCPAQAALDDLADTLADHVHHITSDTIKKLTTNQ